MRIQSQALLSALVLSLLLTACGGGGGGGRNTNPEPPTEPPPPPPPPTTETFTLSGTITASQSQEVDGDTNDPTRIPINNDTYTSAQTISNPVTLGGYVNQPGTGAPGSSQAEGDTDDYYRVQLLKGQTITLLVADFDQSDADLYLYNVRGDILDFSIDTGDVETLVAPADGTFIVNAYAFEGATNYILAIGAPALFSEGASGHHPIMPWQAIVKYWDDDQAIVGQTTAENDIPAKLGIAQRAGARGRARLMELHQAQASAQQRARRLGTASEKLDQITDADLRARWETLATIKSLRKDPRVRYAEPNYKMHALATPNDEAYPVQWHYPLIGLPEAWEITTGDSSIVVAVVDTGVLRRHPDLAGQLVAGYDFVSDRENSGDGDGIDPDPEDPGDSSGATSDSFHGTHVTGTVAARGNNQIGVAGSAYTSRVMPLRALGADGSGTSYDVDQAIRFAAGLANDSGSLPDKPADIINLSLGGGPFSQSTQALFNAVRAAGVIVVAAAGNEASSSPSYPAAYDGVISVSAVDAQRRITGYSNTGSTIDVAAPGGNGGVDLNGDGYPDGVLSTGGSYNGANINYAYTFLSGTSMAAPHVAGVLALMKSVNPGLTPEDIDFMLERGDLSNDLGLAGPDRQYGNGIIDAQRAVIAALEATGQSPADNPRVVSSSGSLNFGSTTTELELVIRNGGKGDLQLLSVTTSEPWLAIEPLSVDAGGLGTYRVTVDRSNLETGIYTADINAQSSVNNLSVRVLLSAGVAGAGTDVGVLYILLYDPILDEPIAQVASNGSGAEYPFQFSGIPAGEYELVAGSDADNDLLICDGGEACGAWLTTDQPIRFQVDGNATGFNFPVDFLVTLPRLSAANADPVQERSRKRQE